MKKTMINMIVLIFAMAQIVACSTHKARINYKDFKDQGVALKSGSWNGEELGVVAGEDGGAI